jgi:hypothetical protein
MIVNPKVRMKIKQPRNACQWITNKMTIKDQQVSQYDVLAVLANEWISSIPAFYVHDNADSLRHLSAADEMLEVMSKNFGAPTTMVNFVKAYLKTAYVKAIKDYLVENNEVFADVKFIGPLPIKVVQADIDAA